MASKRSIVKDQKVEAAPPATSLESKSVQDILLAGNYVSEDDIGKAEVYARTHRASIVDYLLAQNLITKDLLGQATAEHFNAPYADLNSNQPSKERVLQIPEDIAHQYHAVLFKEERESVVIATDRPEATDLIEVLAKIFPSKKISLAYSLPEDIEVAFIHYRKPLATRFAQILKDKKRIAPEILEEIFEDALSFNASDIHFEPRETEVVIRFRIDGVLHEAGSLAREHWENILNRIKVLAHMRIDEHFAAQDGALRYTREKDGKDTYDMRVSAAPMLDGEKVTIRLLAHYVKSFTLGDLGLLPTDEETFKTSAARPFGMILVTGPTGSGKTTTLYALVKFLNRPEVNITTIEDPVEYKIPGVNQIQANPATNLTFAAGLKAIVRQDPNIILVGEIRDKETAEIAVNASLTGHLLLSTFHANDAATAIPRLFDMGVEPFLLSSTLELIIAQRLVRKICEGCRYSGERSPETLVKRFPRLAEYFSLPLTIYQGKGCTSCGNTGHKGRIGIFEVIRMTAEMRELIVKRPPTHEIWKLAKAQGARALFEDGWEKVKQGITTIEELLRVAQP